MPGERFNRRVDIARNRVSQAVQSPFSFRTMPAKRLKTVEYNEVRPHSAIGGQDPDVLDPSNLSSMLRYAHNKILPGLDGNPGVDAAWRRSNRQGFEARRFGLISMIEPRGWKR